MNTIIIILLTLVVILLIALVGAYFVFKKYRSVEAVQKRMRVESQHVRQKAAKMASKAGDRLSK